MSNTYFVREENIDRLEKKLATIKKKCKATNCTFSYEIKGEKFEEVEGDDGTKYTFKYIEVEVDGTARYDGWRFVATIDHHEAGNVIRAYDTTLAIPEKYKVCGLTCEHCNKIRSRKDTYLIFNEDTNEFKQVGKSCLKEFTNGLSAEDVAFLCSIYQKVEDAHEYSGSSYTHYISVEDMIRYAFECYRHWGYQKSDNSYAEENGYIPVGYRSTATRVVQYYNINRESFEYRKKLENEMAEVGFDTNSEYAINRTNEALEWIRNISDDELKFNDYLRNLHVTCSDAYTEYRSIGIIVSLTTAYERHLGQLAEYEKKESAHKKEVEASAYVGEVGDKLEVKTNNFALVTAFENMYGTTFLYKWTDEDGHTFVWYASKSIDNPEEIRTVKGTVKQHSEYNGIKQTVMTRCKVI